MTTTEPTTTTTSTSARSWPVATWTHLAAELPEGHRRLVVLYETLDAVVTGVGGPVDAYDLRAELHFIGQALDDDAERAASTGGGGCCVE